MDGSETVTVGVNQLSTQSGMEDLLDTLEDIQEYSDDDNKKIYALVPGGPSSGISMARFGISRPGDNVAFGWSFIMESVGHELGHVYGLAHAPCGIPSPADPDPNFVPAGGIVGEVGVDPVALSAFPTTSADLMSYCGDRGATNSLISTGGLGAAGESGVTNVINILQREFQMAMVLTGRVNIGSIDRSVIWAWAAVLMGSTVAALPISSRVATRENCESPAG